MRRCRWSQTQLSAARWVLLLQLLLPVQLLGSAPAAHHRSGAAAHPSAHQHERRLAAQKAADTQSVIGTHTDLDAAVAAHGTEGHWGQRQLAMAAGAASQGGTGFTTFGAATGATVSWASRAGGAAAADAAGQAAVAPKPSHCREDLPGCCPKELKHVLLIHIEKTGGTATRRALKQAVAAALPGAIGCDYVRQRRGAYDCLPSADTPAPPHCNRWNQAFYTKYVRTGLHFGSKCGFTAAHHDVQLLDAFPADLAPHTLVVTNLREPLSRTVSHFHMLRRHNHSLALEGSIRRLFLEHPRGMARTRNKQARMLSGDFCCVNGSAIAYDDPAILQRALAAMHNRFCVVGLTERLADTLAYLRFVLGLPQEGPPTAPAPPLPPPAPLGPLRPARPPTNASEHTSGTERQHERQRSLQQQRQEYGDARMQAAEGPRTRVQQGNAAAIGSAHGAAPAALLPAASSAARSSRRLEQYGAQAAGGSGNVTAALRDTGTSGDSGSGSSGSAPSPPPARPAGSRRFVLAPAGRNYGPVDPGVARALLGANGLDVALYGAAEERFQQQMEAMRRAARGGGPAGAGVGEEMRGTAAGGQQVAGEGQPGKGSPTGD